MSKQEISKVPNEEVEEQIKDTEKDYDYRLVEWAIETLLNKFIEKKPNISYKELINPSSPNTVLFVPQYQREKVWKESMKNLFIESIFMKVPMPPLFAFQLDEDGNLELVDGVQRLTTIKEFVDNKFELKGLEVLTNLNGYKFSDFELRRQKKFKNLSLKVYMLNEDTTEGIRADIFNRINSTGEKLRPAEIRKGSYLGNKFYDFILECTKINEFTNLFSSAKKLNKESNEYEKLRGEKEELVTRFFAYSENYLNFEHSVKEFLNDFIKEKGKTFSDKEKKLKKMEFIKTLKFVKDNFPDGFRKSTNAKGIPRVRFESIAVGTNLALKVNPNINNLNLEWLDSKEFKNHVTSGSSNNRLKLVGRIEFVRDCLLNKIKIDELTYDN